MHMVGHQVSFLDLAFLRRGIQCPTAAGFAHETLLKVMDRRITGEGSRYMISSHEHCLTISEINLSVICTYRNALDIRQRLGKVDRVRAIQTKHMQISDLSSCVDVDINSIVVTSS